MAKGQSPVTGAELHKVLADLGYEIRTSGGNRPVVVIDGTEVRIPNDSRKEVVNDGGMTQLARAMGFTRKELADVFLGRATVRGGKPKAKLEEEAMPGLSRSDVLSRLRGLASHVGNIELWLKTGMHSQALYRRIWVAVDEAQHQLLDWPPEGDVPYTSPDDAGYRPTRHDPLTTGVARATGIAAKSVRRGEAYTQWQHEELLGGE